MIARLVTIGLIAAGLSAPVHAQTANDVLNQLLQTAPGAAPQPVPAPVPVAPVAPAEPGLYRHFSAVPDVNSLVEALLPTANTRDLAQIPQGQRTTAGLEIPFDFNSDAINARAQAWLDQLGPAMLDNRVAGYRFALLGHTDASGDRAYNNDLSRRRAASVQQYLMQRWGIPPSRLDLAWYGEDAPRYAANDGRNRRVEAQISGRL